MVARFRSWWQKIKQHRVTIQVVAIILIVAVALVIVGYRFDWTGFNGNNKSGKTLWDWLQLLIIPFALAVIAILFNRTERKNEQRIATDNQQETALQEYIKEMSELLLHGKLRESQPGDEVQTIARVRTLTVLLRLDKERKNSILQFLFESGLIQKNKSLVNLLGANFSKIDLFRAHIHEADLSGTTLIEANLGGTYLQGTSLEGANLTRADLSMSKLNKTSLSNSILSSTTVSVLNRIGRAYMGAYLAGVAAGTSVNNLLGINLRHAILNEADLRGANLTQVDLHRAILLKTKLQHTNLSGANLSEAILIEAKLYNAELSGANLQNAVLVEADLHKAKLIEADLREADLYGANLQEADLSKADLSGANLNGANLAKAIVTTEQLNTAKFKRIIMPDGKIYW